MTSSSNKRLSEHNSSRHLRRPRPGSCSLEELLNAAESTQEAEAEAAADDPPPAPMTSRVDLSRDWEQEKDAFKEKSNRHSPISMQTRMSMLSNIGGGGAIGSIGSMASRRSRFYGTLLDTGKLTSGGTIASGLNGPRGRSRSGDSRASALLSGEKGGLASGGSHVGRLLGSSGDRNDEMLSDSERRIKEEWRKSWSPSLLIPPIAPEPFEDERSPFHYSYPPSETAPRDSSTLRATGAPSALTKPLPAAETGMAIGSSRDASFFYGNPTRLRSNTVGAGSYAYSETGGDRRVLNLLEELKLTKYWPKFLQEEILLEDMDGMKEKVSFVCLLTAHSRPRS